MSPTDTINPATCEDPLRRGRVVLRRTRVVCAAAVLVTGVWGFWPLRAPRTDEPAPTKVVPVEVPSSAAPLTLAGFDAPVFTQVPEAEETKVATAAPPPPPPPLKLLLLGISRSTSDDGAFIATLFDPDADRVRSAAAGETLAGWRVERVSAEGVSLRQGQASQHLALRTDKPTKGGGTP